MKFNRVNVLLIKICLFAVLLSSITSCARYKTGELLTKGDNGGKFYTNEEIEAVVAFRDKFRIKNNLPLPTDIPRTEIGIFIMNGLLYVPVTVNGKKGNMVLDSGASGISLSIETFESLGGTYNVDDSAYFYFPREIDLGFGKIAYTANYSGMFNRNGMGYVGSSIYGFYAERVTFDYKNRKLILNDEVPNVEPISCDVSTGHIVTEGKVNGVPVKICLDTGAPTGLINNEIFNFPLTDMLTEDVNWEYFNSTMLTGNSYYYDVELVEIGNITLTKTFTGLVVQDSATDMYADVLSSINVDMLLGYDFFARNRITVDYKNGLLWLESY